jgi:monoamine oxidase
MVATGVTRRAFVNLVGRAGGAGAAYATLNAMGLLPVPTAYAGPPQLPPASGRGSRVVILGAGIAGMVAAYELRKAGYQITVLEARDRVGGRNWTVRGGDSIVENEGTTQRVAWDQRPNLYFNAGPARLPYHHQGILSYCRELGVALEIIMNDNRGALMQDERAFEGRPIQARRLINDARGFIAELAAKGLTGSLDQPMSEDDAQNIREYIRAFGPLGPDLKYHGSSRAGYAEVPGAATESGRQRAPLALAEIAKGESFRETHFFGEGWDQAATMMQPVGGMDSIPRAFARALGALVTTSAEVTQIRRAGEKARVVWRDRRRARDNAIDADYVICTFPLPVLQRLDADFSPPVKAAIDAGAALYVPAVKIAFQADRRWWETDYNIYGGISWTSRDITQMWYPSAGIHSDKGVVVGAYIWTNAIGERFAAMTPEQRVTAALADGEHLHSDYAQLVTRGVSVPWSRIPFSGGAWIEWDDAPDARRDAYPVLLGADGPYHFAGEHMSHINGWQEGAVRSAHYTIEQIAERVRVRHT